jgi:hypothetical protein
MVRWWRVLGSWEKTGEERIGCSVQRYEMQVEHALVELWENVGARGYMHHVLCRKCSRGPDNSAAFRLLEYMYNYRAVGMIRI